MINDWGYHLIISILEIFMWDGELVGGENLQEGPGVIVSNHMGAVGPVGVCSSLPMRLYPWVLGATVDKVEAPEMVRKDFVEKVLHLKPPLSLKVAQGLCKISTPLLLSLGCIPVPVSHERQEETFQCSLSLLRQGKFLLVAPEDPNAEADPITGIRPFKRGFLRLGELYAQETGKALRFYPVIVHEAGLVVVEKPVEYNALNVARQERIRVISLLEGTIKSRYLEITETQAVQPIFLRKKTL